MDEWLRIALIVCPLVFCAGFVDSVAGGGGVISIPAYMLAGLPAYMTAGTNKFVSSFGTATAALKYFKSGKVLLRVALFSAIGSIVGGFAGANLALRIPEQILRIILVGALPVVAVFLSVKRDFGAVRRQTPISGRAQALISLVIGLVIGCYDGLIGPGTGTFLILAYTGVLGVDLITASGCAKVSNLASNLVSMVVYAVGGKVLYAVALPAMAFCMAGNYAGARFAIRGGGKSVRKIMYVVLALLFVRVLLETLGVF